MKRELVDKNEVLERLSLSDKDMEIFDIVDMMRGGTRPSVIMNMFKKIIKGMVEPVENAEEVTYCKDCRYCMNIGVGDKEPEPQCVRHLKSKAVYPIKPNDYCSYGEVVASSGKPTDKI